MVFFPISLIDTDITFVCCNINELIFCLDNWLFNCLLLIYCKYLDSFFHFALPLVLWVMHTYSSFPCWQQSLTLVLGVVLIHVSSIGFRREVSV